MSVSREAIEDIVKEGLVKDIFRFERARSIQKIMHDRSDAIGSKDNGNFGSTFHALHYALTTEAVLAVARIFDNPSKEYPTRCTKGLFAHLEKYSEELPAIKEPYQLQLSLSTRATPEGLIACIDKNPIEFPVRLRAYIETEFSAPPLSEAFEKLKTQRDKVHAHNERAFINEGPTWTYLEALVELAKYLVGALGWAYFNTAYTANGDYLLTNDAKRPSIGFARLLDRVYGQQNT